MSSTAVTRPPAGPAEPIPQAPPRPAPPRLIEPVWAIVGAITIAAAALRLIHLGQVRLDPFYDAAVRSMGLSWHNFFFGAFEPGGSVSIDKPPVDLWLQVASVKVLGFNSTALKLPEALAGTLAAPALFAVVRRGFGDVAGIVAALAIAVMPIEVVTARSDTMDAVMMLLVVLAALCILRAADSGHTRWLYGGAALIGVAFNVKLLQALIPVPALALLALLALPGPWRRRARRLALAGAVFVAFALSWLTATLLFPAHDRPYAIGSTNGSAWNAAFVFNGSDRLFGAAQQGDEPARAKGYVYPTATQVQRDHVPITAPAVTRLLDNIGPMEAERLGFELLAALLLGVPALILVLRRRPPGPALAAIAPRRAGSPEDAERVRRALAAALLLWLATGTVLFSAMARLHPRYVEAFTPAVAATLGVGIAWVLGLRGRLRAAVLAVALGVLVGYAYHLEFGAVRVWWVTLVAALAALAVLALIERPRLRRVAAPATALLALTAVLAIPANRAIYEAEQNASAAGNVGALPAGELTKLSSFLRAHQGTATYEVAAASATRISSLVVKDVRPVLVLTTYNARPLLSVSALARLVAAGKVRYAVIDGVCGPRTPSTHAACSPPARWVAAHGVDVGHEAGLRGTHTLYRLPVPLA